MRRLPPWFKRPLGDTPERKQTEEILRKQRLHTVCNSAACPNRGECFSDGTATFMILGDCCTRDCRFCNVASAPPSPPDSDEPRRIAEACREMGLRYVVLTSVTRDDLPDGGAEHFGKTVRAVRESLPESRIEILTSDFDGNFDVLNGLFEASPEVWGHNIEVVPRKYSDLRPQADYQRSLDLLRRIKEGPSGMITKSALMIGVGETQEEILEACLDLREAKTDLLVIGQYMAPSKDHYPVERFYTPTEFREIGDEVRRLGFAAVLSKPWARSSYKADAMHRAIGADAPQPEPR